MSLVFMAVHTYAESHACRGVDLVNSVNPFVCLLQYRMRTPAGWLVFCDYVSRTHNAPGWR